MSPPPMRFKPDWPAARERLAALWEGRPLDRPCIAVTAPSGQDVHWPGPPAGPEQRWMDPAWVVPHALACMQSTWWGGEAIPSYLLMAGWVFCLGGDVRFDDNTIWHERRPLDFDRPPRFPFDPADPWVQRHDALYTALAAAAGEGDFLLGGPLLLPANDLLAMQMGTEHFLLALADRGEWMADAIVEGARCQIAARRHCRNLVAARHAYWYGNAGWMPFWAPQPFHQAQSDVSCMISPDMFDRFILPELALYADQLGPLWYHLDGGNACQHLPRLLSLPYLRVVQYTPAPGEPPNGPDHLALYRQIQAAGKIVHVSVPKQHVEALLNSLDGALLLLETGCDSIAEAESLLARLSM
ncbi:MAG: hypothetical protein NTV86_11540 [Planctomycetota bacterium]|nr:hypothetical protein [Planctomycetota bacterium]